MTLPAEALLLGAVIGMTYGLTAVGLVLTFRASRVLNLAHGQIGAFAAVLALVLVQRWGVAYWAAFLVVLAVGAALSAAVELTIVRRLRGAPPVMTLVATLGLAQVLLFAGVAIAGAPDPELPFPQPAGLPEVEVGALTLRPAHVGMLVLGPLAVAALAWLLRATDLGVRLRGVASNPEGARLLGLPAGRLAAVTWALAGALAAMTAVLLLPAFGAGTDAAALGPALLLRALAAAVLAAMASLPVALLAGVGIGVLEQVILANSADATLLDALLFGALFVALLARPEAAGRLAARGAWTAVGRWAPLPDAARAVPLVRSSGWALGAVVLAGAALLPLVLRADEEIAATSVVCLALAGLSVWVATGLAGQVTLGQFAFAGAGAAAAAAVGSPWLALPAAALAGAAAAVLVGLPGLRGAGIATAVTTLAFALAAEGWLLSRDWALGAAGKEVEPLAGSHAGGLWIALAALAVCLVMARNLGASGAGRRLVAARDNEPAARAFGVRPRPARAQALALAGAMAGVAGALLAMALFRTPASSFPVTASFNVAAIAVVGGLGWAGGPLLGALLIAALPQLVDLPAAGLAATAAGWLLLLLYLPGGLSSAAAHARDAGAALLLRAAGHDPALARPPAAPASPLERPDGVPASALRVLARRDAPGTSAPALELSGIHRFFGDVTAVGGVDLRLQAGEAVALVGPNGAGKTTLLDIASGHLRADHGRVRLFGADVTRAAPEARAARGLVRSFQDATLFPTLSVREVVQLGVERASPPGLARGAALGAAGERRAHAQARELVALLGLDAYAAARCDALSTGTRRIAELACVLAMRPRVLLLDEPTAGIAQREAEALAELLDAVRRELGLTMLLVEHDLWVARRVADRVLVMDGGRVVAEDAARASRARLEVVPA